MIYEVLIRDVVTQRSHVCAFDANSEFSAVRVATNFFKEIGWPTQRGVRAWRRECK
jgi:hypothetical protein